MKRVKLGIITGLFKGPNAIGPMVYKLDQATILLVEDMEPMLSLTKSLLSIFGFRDLIGARDGQEGYELFKKHDPDVVITDWMMEPVDGLEMIETIRQDDASPNPYVPIVLMTGFSDRLRVESARDMGVTEILVKPYSSRDLYNRIVQIIEKPRQFVDSGDFFGPDRRRRKSFEYDGAKRRDNDREAQENTKDKRIAAEILQKLREDTKNI